ncbi:MAG: DUF3299 domain-containing protein [Saprospirales bacterium]|nr:DUF3299 domain-containing protein [Saprospirales bacterium]MBK8492655.1 DUF3299 domain-containing protein [Saprospirales bacterium]
MKQLSFALFVSLLILACGSPEPPASTQAEPAPAIDTTPPPPTIDTTQFPLIDGYYKLDWNLLGKVAFEQRWHDSLNDYVYFPVFHQDILLFAGKPVQIGGYIIPLEETENSRILVLSAFPYSSCFFCGNAGPESVMDIQLADQAKVGRGFKQDAQTTFRGRLRLNDTDVYYLNYILEEAMPVD